MNLNPSRRAFLGIPAWLLADPSEAADDWREALKDALADKSTLTLGREILPIDDPAWDEVDRLMNTAPTRGVAPLDIADFLRRNIPEKYQGAWPGKYANPLVVRLFISTKTKPTGDITPWCAAFANWCLTRVGFEGTKSASSQSFSDWGSEVWNVSSGKAPIDARRGDIALFRLRSDPSSGHVTFFESVSGKYPDHIDVLGGNQIKAEVHRISRDSFRTKGNLELISVRTMAGLRPK